VLHSVDVEGLGDHTSGRSYLPWRCSKTAVAIAIFFACNVKDSPSRYKVPGPGLPEHAIQRSFAKPVFHSRGF
jgi:hypothetical protein